MYITLSVGKSNFSFTQICILKDKKSLKMCQTIILKLQNFAFMVCFYKIFTWWNNVIYVSYTKTYKTVVILWQKIGNSGVANSFWSIISDVLTIKLAIKKQILRNFIFLIFPFRIGTLSWEKPILTAESGLWIRRQAFICFLWDNTLPIIELYKNKV